MTFPEKLVNYKAGIIDMGLTKLAVFAGALFIAKLWDPILSLEWYWYLIIWVVAAIKPLATVLKWLGQK